jgi:hypothetical protein
VVMVQDRVHDQVNDRVDENIRENGGVYVQEASS